MAEEIREWRVLQVNDHYRPGEPPLSIAVKNEEKARTRHLDIALPYGTGTERVVAIQNRVVGSWEDAN